MVSTADSLQDGLRAQSGYWRTVQKGNIRLAIGIGQEGDFDIEEEIGFDQGHVQGQDGLASISIIIHLQVLDMGKLGGVEFHGIGLLGLLRKQTQTHDDAE